MGEISILCCGVNIVYSSETCKQCDFTLLASEVLPAQFSFKFKLDALFTIKFHRVVFQRATTVTCIEKELSTCYQAVYVHHLAGCIHAHLQCI